MAEYIERDSFLKLISHKPSCPTTDREDRLIDGFISAVKNCPAADVRPVVRGKWTRRKSKLYTMCSACGYGYSNSHYHKAEEFKFCPNCGAMMEESWLDWLKQEASE